MPKKIPKIEALLHDKEEDILIQLEVVSLKLDFDGWEAVCIDALTGDAFNESEPIKVTEFHDIFFDEFIETKW